MRDVPGVRPAGNAEKPNDGRLLSQQDLARDRPPVRLTTGNVNRFERAHRETMPFERNLQLVGNVVAIHRVKILCASVPIYAGRSGFRHTVFGVINIERVFRTRVRAPRCSKIIAIK